jgi:hypothetical protein
MPQTLRAVPFKYTWERGETPLISEPPPIEKKYSTHHHHQNLLQ